LGARRVNALELDGEALSNAQANVQANAVSDRVHLIHGDAFALLALVAPIELVLANIISGVLESLLPRMETSLTLRGRAILGGLLVSEREAFSALLIARGWRILDDCSEGDWWTVAIARS
ncbi:MAG: 50S ribosomal protein L11 methyltransferase, partial [Steroidobacteraceae bacterium]